MGHWGGISRRVVVTGAVAAVAVGSPLFWLEAGSGVEALTQPPPTPKPTPTLTPPVPGKFGSGQLVDWRRLSRSVSGGQHIRHAVRTDGVVMFGDSLGVQAGPLLAQRLASRTKDTLAAHNWSGQPTRPAVDALQLWSRYYGLPRRILMAVGTNDIFDPPVLTAQIERVMAVAGPTRTVVWVNVFVARRKWSTADRTNSTLVNRQLSTASRRHPNLRLVPWAEFLTADPRRPRRYLRDGVHCTPLGLDARNELIVRALEAAKAPTD